MNIQIAEDRASVTIADFSAQGYADYLRIKRIPNYSVVRNNGYWLSGISRGNHYM
jgi:hypothetical protein